jgi:hypothetical protein
MRRPGCLVPDLLPLVVRGEVFGDFPSTSLPSISPMAFAGTPFSPKSWLQSQYAIPFAHALTTPVCTGKILAWM